MEKKSLQISVAQYSEILKDYGVLDEICEVVTIWNAVEKINADYRIKVITRLHTAHRTYIIKVIREEEHPITVIEDQSVFSEVLRENGISTSKKYKSTCGTFAIVRNYQSNNCVVTLEDSIGSNELEYINETNVKEVARLLAKAHKISKQEKCYIGTNTIWDLFDDKKDINVPFRSFNKLINENLEMFSDEMVVLINNKYNSVKENLTKVWDKLPRYAVQGDISTNNFIVDDNADILGIIDYNIAGNEVLVNDMITEGLFYTYIMDLDPTKLNLTRKEYFDIFIQEYLSERELEPLEQACMNEIYSIVFSFLWNRVDNLKSYVEKKETGNINTFMEDTLKILEGNYFGS